jgi:hypothetical protein
MHNADKPLDVPIGKVSLTSMGAGREHRSSAMVRAND